MNRKEKQDAVADLHESFAGSMSAFVLGFQGISVADVTELRRQVRQAKSRYLVVKNTLALHAVKGTLLEPVSGQFAGATAVAFTADQPVALAKVLTNFAKNNSHLTFRAAVVEGRVIPVSEITAIAELPTREELVTKLLFLLQSPLRRLANVLDGPARNLVSVLRQVADIRGQAAPSADAGAGA